MAAAIVWSQEALDDIDAIADYISRDSPYHAQRVVEMLYELGDGFAAHPQAGRIVPELGNPQVRERFSSTAIACCTNWTLDRSTSWP